MDKIQSSLDSLRIEKEKENQRIKDSLLKAKEKIEQKIEKLDDKSGNQPEAYIRNNEEYNFIMHI